MTSGRSFATAFAVALCAFALMAAGVTDAVAGPGPQGSPLKPAHVLRIVAFGSSSTAGVGATQASATYPAQLQSDLAATMPVGSSLEVVNRGIGGEDIDDMIRRIEVDVIARHPDLVIWQIGSNDPLRHVPLDRFERETRQGIAAMRAAGITVVLMDQQWCPRLEANVQAESFRDVVHRIGRDMNIAVIHRADMMHQWVGAHLLTPTQMLSPDGLHMTDKSYALLARGIAPQIRQAIDARTTHPMIASAAARTIATR